jgi:hypothetical protein
MVWCNGVVVWWSVVVWCNSVVVVVKCKSLGRTKALLQCTSLPVAPLQSCIGGIDTQWKVACGV